MKRILLISDSWPPDLGGGAIHAAELVKRLRRLGWKITVLKRGSSSHLAARLWFLCAAIIRGFFIPADMIHAHAFLGAIPGKVIAMGRRIPIILTVHGTRLHTDDAMGHGSLDGLFRWLEERILLKTRYDAEISVDHRFLRLPNVNTRRVVIPNGIDVNRFAGRMEEKHEPPAILFVGRLHAQKGLPYLLEAFRQLRKKHDVRLWIVGDGPDRSSLLRIARRHDLQDDVIFWGPVFGRRLVRLYKQASVFVLPSLYEGSPLTLFEAWAAKLPVIVTDVGDNRRVVRHGKNGLVVQPKDSRSLTRALMQLLTSPNARSMGQAGFRLAKKEYSWDTVAQQTARVYEEVLSCRMST